MCTFEEMMVEAQKWGGRWRCTHWHEEWYVWWSEKLGWWYHGSHGVEGKYIAPPSDKAATNWILRV